MSAISFLCLESNAQIEGSGSPLSSEKYFENPREYLSKIDTNSLTTEILLDRSIYDEIVKHSDGKNTITTFDFYDFSKVYEAFHLGHTDTIGVEFDSIVRVGKMISETANKELLMILDYEYDYIDSAAIVSGDFIESDSMLNDDNSESDSFQKGRVVAFSGFTRNIFGDDITFELKEGLFVSEVKGRTLSEIEIDFDDGVGFRPIYFDEPITASYNESSDYIYLNLKITYYLENGEEEIVEAQHTVYRMSSDLVPLASENLSSLDQTLGINESSDGIPKPKQNYFPEPVFTTFKNPLAKDHVIWEGPVYASYTIEYSLIMNPQNKSGKLRRPIIMVDGFDPGNKRGYYTTRQDELSGKLPKDLDLRGLYHYLDGQRSPWDKYDLADNSISNVEKDAGLVKALQDEGYDIMIINWLEGAGDINKNAKMLRRFFNEVINEQGYRDNKTEEIVLVGPSMGGVITRIALTEMEQAGEEHFVKTWISFDAPHTGAYIPIGLQYAMRTFSKSRVGKISQKGKSGLDKMNTIAARQLFYQHYGASTKSGGAIKKHTLNPDQAHLNLIEKLGDLHFPQFSKNYAITNGGKEILYSEDKQQIGKIQMKIYGGKHSGMDAVRSDLFTQNNSLISGTYVADGIQDNIRTAAGNRIKLENAPGGWHGALYTFNRQRDNELLDDTEGVEFQNACFIPTCSAFGIPISNETAHMTWDKFTNMQNDSSALTRTPFDEIIGMQNRNEEHLKISYTTRVHIVDNWLDAGVKNINRPINRINSERKNDVESSFLIQTCSRPCAYISTDSIKFAGNMKQFIFKKGSDARIVADSRISFRPGFSSVTGSIVNALIDKKQKGNAFQRKKISTSIPLSTSASNKFENGPVKTSTIQKSSDNKDVQTEVKKEIEIYPNPCSEFITINHGFKDGEIVVQDVNGKVLKTNVVMNSESVMIEMNDLNKGVYIIQLFNQENTHEKKIVKL